MIVIESGPFRLAAVPEAGGSIASLDWHGHPLLRRQQGASADRDVLGRGYFALVPFSNRLRGSRFHCEGQEIFLHPNHPHDPTEPAMHGLGWRRPWRVVHHAADRLDMALDVPAGTAPGDWPRPFRAEHWFQLDAGSALFGLARASGNPC